MLIEEFQRLRVDGTTLMHGTTRIGPASALYVDGNEEARGEGIVHQNLPYRIDYLMCVGDKVVGVESKLPPDATSSHSVRRLARQMEVLIHTVDVPCLMLRGWPLGKYDTQTGGYAEPSELYVDILKWQLLGVVLLPGPAKAIDVPEMLGKYRVAMMHADTPGDRLVWQAIAGSDHKVERGGPGWYLRAIPGIGHVLSAKLIAAWGNTAYALEANDAEWKEVGASKTAIHGRHIALGEECECK